MITTFCTYSTKKPYDVPLSVNTPNSSQYIKQELRNICSARLEKPSFQSQMPPSQLMQQLQPQQQQLQQQAHQQQQDNELETGSELPPDILDQSKLYTASTGYFGYSKLYTFNAVHYKMILDKMLV